MPDMPAPIISTSKYVVSIVYNYLQDKMQQAVYTTPGQVIIISR
jgi:hypothetical protein